jgi:adsorption protein B
MAIAVLQMAVRMGTCARVYGWTFAWAAPLRLLWGNVVNSTATLKALVQYLQARRARRHLAWLKTDHVYPGPGRPERDRPRLGELLVRMRSVPMSAVEEALVSGRNGLRLGEYLVQSHRLSEDSLYQALSCQSGIPLGPPANGEINPRITRSIPADVARRWKILPYRIELGQLHVATPDPPTEQLARDLAGMARLEIRFHLVQPRAFEELVERYLGAGCPK